MLKIIAISFIILWFYSFTCIIASGIISYCDGKKSNKEYTTTRSKIWFIIRSIFYPILVIFLPFYGMFILMFNFKSNSEPECQCNTKET